MGSAKYEICKEACLDEVHMEMIQALDEDGIDIGGRMVSTIYETGEFPKDLLKSPKYPKYQIHLTAPATEPLV